MAWTELAACKGRGDLFFDSDKIETALAICAICPIQERCRQEALDNGEVFGVWGGLTENHPARKARKLGQGRVRIDWAIGTTG